MRSASVLICDLRELNRVKQGRARQSIDAIDDLVQQNINRSDRLVGGLHKQIAENGGQAGEDIFNGAECPREGGVDDLPSLNGEAADSTEPAAQRVEHRTQIEALGDGHPKAPDHIASRDRGTACLIDLLGGQANGFSIGLDFARLVELLTENRERSGNASGGHSDRSQDRSHGANRQPCGVARRRGRGSSFGLSNAEDLRCCARLQLCVSQAVLRGGQTIRRSFSGSGGGRVFQLRSGKGDLGLRSQDSLGSLRIERTEAGSRRSTACRSRIQLRIARGFQNADQGEKGDPELLRAHPRLHHNAADLAALLHKSDERVGARCNLNAQVLKLECKVRDLMAGKLPRLADRTHRIGSSGLRSRALLYGTIHSAHSGGRARCSRTDITDRGLSAISSASHFIKVLRGRSNVTAINGYSEVC